MPGASESLFSSMLLCVGTTLFPTDTMLRICDLCVFSGSAMLVAVCVAAVKMHDPLLKGLDDALDVIACLRDKIQQCFDPELLITETKKVLTLHPLEAIERRQAASRLKQNEQTVDKLAQRATECMAGIILYALLGFDRLTRVR